MDGGYVGGGIVAATSIVVAVLARLQNRDSKTVDENLGVAKEQREGWSSLLSSKDAEIGRLNVRVEKLEAACEEKDEALARLADPAREIAERDAMIASLVAKLGPVESPTIDT